MRMFRYLLHLRAANAQPRLRIIAYSPEPLLCVYEGLGGIHYSLNLAHYSSH